MMAATAEIATGQSVDEIDARLRTGQLLRPYKVQLHRSHLINVGDDCEIIKKGFGARNLRHLIEQACSKFKVTIDGAKLGLDDGTEVDEEDYFSLLPDGTLFFLVPAPKHDSFRFWKVASDLVRKVWHHPATPKDDLMMVVKALATDDGIRRRIQDAIDRADINLKDSKLDDPNWFQGLKTNVISKEAWLTKNAKERVRSYYVKSKEDVESSLFLGGPKRRIDSDDEPNADLRLNFDTVFECMRTKLAEHNYYANYFGRSERCSSERLCDDHGWFRCQGEYHKPDCEYLHRINPYGNRVSRIMFSTWNLDHVIERSRSIVPSLAEAILEVSSAKKISGQKTRLKGRRQDGPTTVDRQVNWKYFHELLFVARRGKTLGSNQELDANLKLVHTVCHVKTAHANFHCDRCKYF